MARGTSKESLVVRGMSVESLVARVVIVEVTLGRSTKKDGTIYQIAKHSAPAPKLDVLI